MDLFVWLCRAALIIFFALAAVLKTRRFAAFASSLQSFGLSLRTSRPAALAVLSAEAVTAAALTAQPIVRPAGVAAAALSLSFIAAVMISRAQGNQPECRCFGSEIAKPAGTRTIVLNLLVCAGALVIAVWGSRVTAALAIDELHMYLVMAEPVAVVVFAMVLVGALLLIVGQQGRILLRLQSFEQKLSALSAAGSPSARPAALPATEALRVGNRVPRLTLPDLDGNLVALEAECAGRHLLLVFTDPNCAACTAIWPEVQQWIAEFKRRLTVLVITRGPAQASQRKCTDSDVRCLLQSNAEALSAFNIPATPAMLLLKPDCTLDSKAAVGASDMRLLARQIAEQWQTIPPLSHYPDHKQKGRMSVGDPVEPAELTSSSDGSVEVQFKGVHATAVFFVSLSCGYCRGMWNELRAWDAAHGRGIAGMIMLAGPPIESPMLIGLRSKIFFDSTGAFGRRFGISGTPALVLIDVNGMLASGVVLGSQPIFEALKLDDSELVTAQC